MIKLTAAAIEPLRATRPDEDGYALRVIVMDEGCGCGAPLLYDLAWDFPRTTDQHMAVEGIPILVDPQAEFYLEAPTWIDYSPEHRAFRLYSAGQIYNNLIYLS